MTMNGILGRMPSRIGLVGLAKCCRKCWNCWLADSSWSRPMPMEPANASTRLCMRATTIAANEPSNKRVNWMMVNPRSAPRSTPAAPARVVPIIQDTAVTNPVFTPLAPAIARESTAARTESPYGVARNSTTRTTAMSNAANTTATWFESTCTPTIVYSCAGDQSMLGCRTDEAVLGYKIAASAGSATDRPMVETSRTEGGVSLKRLNSTAHKKRPASGEKTKIVTRPARCEFQPHTVVTWKNVTAMKNAIAPCAKLKMRDVV